MKINFLLVLIYTFGLCGCASLNQFPVVAKDYNQSLNELDADYAMAVKLIYGPSLIEKTKDGTPSPPLTPPTLNEQQQKAKGGTAAPAFTPPSSDEQKRIRRGMMERRMAVIDAYFKEFQAELVKENVQSEFGIALLGVGIGAAGSLVPETASQILSAVSGGLTGAQAAYGKAALYEKTISALLAQMQAGRKTVAAQIFQRWNLDLDQYPMWMTRMDLDAYYFAGTIPGAILGTAADAKVKETEANDKIRDAILLRPITKKSASKEMDDKRDNLNSRISKLDGTKAKKLVAEIENGAKSSTSFKEAKTIIDDQYPNESRSKDTDGKIATVSLRRAVIHSVKNEEEAKVWETLIDTIEKQ